MLWERFLFAVISECFTEFFTACCTFLLLLCRKVGGGRKTASKMSAKRLYEQARATLRTKQRGTDGRSTSGSINRFSLSLFLSLSMLLSPYFFLYWPFLMTNTLILHVSFVYFRFLLFSFLCVFLWFGYLHRASHWTAQPYRLQSATLQKNASIIWFHSRLSFAVLAWGVDAAAGWKLTYKPRIVGRVTYSLPFGRYISLPLLYKIKKKKKTVLQNHNLWPDWFLAIKLDGEGERERERDRLFKKCLSPVATRILRRW